jgi:thioredoxin-like negative regulator of GroEL
MGALSNVVQVSTRLRRSTVAQLFARLAHAEDERTRLRGWLVRQTRSHPANLNARIKLARFLVREGELTAAQNQLQRAAEADLPGGPARRALAGVERWLRVQAG